MVYVFKEQWRWMLEDGDWDPVRFDRDGVSAFLSEYQGFFRSEDPGQGSSAE